jgi:hypothetical protein
MISALNTPRTSGISLLSLGLSSERTLTIPMSTAVRVARTMGGDW